MTHSPIDTWARERPVERRYETKWLGPAQCCVTLWSGGQVVGVGFGRSSEAAGRDALSGRGAEFASEMQRAELARGLRIA